MIFFFHFYLDWSFLPPTHCQKVNKWNMHQKENWNLVKKKKKKKSKKIIKKKINKWSGRAIRFVLVIVSNEWEWCQKPSLHATPARCVSEVCWERRRTLCSIQRKFGCWKRHRQFSISAESLHHSFIMGFRFCFYIVAFCAQYRCCQKIISNTDLIVAFVIMIFYISNIVRH